MMERLEKLRQLILKNELKAARDLIYEISLSLEQEETKE